MRGLPSALFDTMRQLLVSTLQARTFKQVRTFPEGCHDVPRGRTGEPSHPRQVSPKMREVAAEDLSIRASPWPRRRQSRGKRLEPVRRVEVGDEHEDVLVLIGRGDRAVGADADVLLTGDVDRVIISLASFRFRSGQRIRCPARSGRRRTPLSTTDQQLKNPILPTVMANAEKRSVMQLAPMSVLAKPLPSDAPRSNSVVRRPARSQPRATNGSRRRT
jgi:hypothetical protein